MAIAPQSVTVNLDPARFVFWHPAAGAVVHAGADRHPVSLPEVPLPLHAAPAAAATPADEAIGAGVYDYLRQFPDCAGNRVYAELLKDAFPHYLSDLAAHAVLLDAKQLEPAYVLRKLSCLKILRLVDPCNCGLLAQLCRGYFELALEFAELPRCRRHFLEAMRFGQEWLSVAPDDLEALALLADIDLFIGDLPAAHDKWRRLARLVADPATREKISARIASLPAGDSPQEALVDELEAVAEAMRLHVAGAHREAADILERLEAQGQLVTLLPSADFYYLLGVCQQRSADAGGAYRSFNRALELDPEHAGASAGLRAHFLEVSR